MFYLFQSVSSGLAFGLLWWREHNIMNDFTFYFAPEDLKTILYMAEFYMLLNFRLTVVQANVEGGC